MVQRQVWRHHCLISEPECLTHSRHQDSTHTRTSTIKTSRPEWEVIKAWWDSGWHLPETGLWNGRLTSSDFPAVLGGPINYRETKVNFHDVCLVNDPPVLFLVHCHIFILKSSYLLLVNIHLWLVERVSSSSCTLSTQRRSKAYHHHLNKVTRLALRAFYWLITRDKNILLQVNFYIWHQEYLNLNLQ